jgi:hypothetical protein
MEFWQKVNFEPPNRAYAHPLNIQYMFILSIHVFILVLLENFEFGPHIYIPYWYYNFKIFTNFNTSIQIFFNEIETFDLGWYYINNNHIIWATNNIFGNMDDVLYIAIRIAFRKFISFFCMPCFVTTSYY